MRKGERYAQAVLPVFAKVVGGDGRFGAVTETAATWDVRAIITFWHNPLTATVRLYKKAQHFHAWMAKYQDGSSPVCK